MKESRFIELLNLYIDRQITAGEIAELEAELQRDPKRQAVYRQYCRIHSATKLVYDSFRTEAAGQPEVAAAGKGGVVELFESRRRRSQWMYYTGAFAAAACLALVFVMNRPNPEGAPAAELASQPVSVPVVAAAPVPADPVRVIAEPSPVSLRNSVVTVTPDYAAMLAALREQDEERDFNSERHHLGRLQPLFNDTMFEPARVLTSQDQRVFRSQPTATPVSAQQTEFSAFQFQR